MTSSDDKKQPFVPKLPLRVEVVKYDDITSMQFVVDADGLTVSRELLVEMVNASVRPPIEPNCDCTKYNGGPCYNCLNGRCDICDSGQGQCARTAWRKAAKLSVPSAIRASDEWRQTLLDVTNALADRITNGDPYSRIVLQARALLAGERTEIAATVTVPRISMEWLARQKTKLENKEHAAYVAMEAVSMAERAVPEYLAALRAEGGAK